MVVVAWELTFTRPCTWLFISALCMVRVDILLVADPNYICARCNGKVWYIDGRTMTRWMLMAPCLMWRSLYTTSVTWCASTWLFSTVAKCYNWMALTCVAAMTEPWFNGSVAQKMVTKHPRHHYQKLGIKNITTVLTVGGWDGMSMYTVPRPVANLSRTYRPLALKGEEGLKRRSLNVWRPMSENVASTLISKWTRKIDLDGLRLLMCNPCFYFSVLGCQYL